MSKLTTATTLSIGALMLVFGAAKPLAATGQDDAVKKGEQVYTAQKCQTCHSIGGKGNKQNPLDGVGKKLSADEIKAWIVTPTEMTKKSGSTKKPPMPNRYSKLPAADIDALVAYLVSLK
jgi:mono/diheme cytochrome c family protein